MKLFFRISRNNVRRINYYGAWIALWTGWITIKYFEKDRVTFLWYMLAWGMAVLAYMFFMVLPPDNKPIEILKRNKSETPTDEVRNENEI